MSIEELLQQMEDYRNRRERRDHRPQWLRSFIQNAAEVFEPLEHAGRVGFDCQLSDRNWIVTMYLGTTEIIGGPRDGQIDHVSYRIDLCRMTDLFESVDRLEWYSLSNEHDERFNDSTRSLISVVGTVEGEQTVQLEVLGTPPRYVGPGLKNHHTALGGNTPG